MHICLDVDDTRKNIAEVQLGIQWSQCRAGGGSWFVRGAFESQYWSGGVIGDGDSEDVAFVGPTFSIGLSR